jgi:hypothetical protein
VFWTLDDGVVQYPLGMKAETTLDAVRILFPTGQGTRVAMVRRSLPRSGGVSLLYRCPGCFEPRRYLYQHGLFGGEIVRHQKLRRLAPAVELKWGWPFGPSYHVVAIGITRALCMRGHRSIEVVDRLGKPISTAFSGKRPRLEQRPHALFEEVGITLVCSISSRSRPLNSGPVPSSAARSSAAVVVGRVSKICSE